MGSEIEERSARAEPFGVGNRAARRHGSYARLSDEPETQRIADDVREMLPAYAPIDEVLVQAFAVTARRVQNAVRAIESADLVAEGRELTQYMTQSAPALDRLRQDLRGWLRLLRSLAADLAASPASRSRVGLDVALTQRALGRTLLERYTGDES